jgi:hypothetical protein
MRDAVGDYRRSAGVPSSRDVRGVFYNLAAWAFLVTLTSAPFALVAAFIPPLSVVAQILIITFAVAWCESIARKPIYDFYGREIIRYKR